MKDPARCFQWHVSHDKMRNKNHENSFVAINFSWLMNEKHGILIVQDVNIKFFPLVHRNDNWSSSPYGNETASFCHQLKLIYELLLSMLSLHTSLGFDACFISLFGLTVQFWLFTHGGSNIYDWKLHNIQGYHISLYHNLIPLLIFQIVKNWEANKSWIPRERIDEVRDHFFPFSFLLIISGYLRWNLVLLCWHHWLSQCRSWMVLISWRPGWMRRRVSRSEFLLFSLIFVQHVVFPFFFFSVQQLS